jgi:hypothetical protein
MIAVGGGGGDWRRVEKAAPPGSHIRVYAHFDFTVSFAVSCFWNFTSLFLCMRNFTSLFYPLVNETTVNERDRMNFLFWKTREKGEKILGWKILKDRNRMRPNLFHGGTK